MLLLLLFCSRQLQHRFKTTNRPLHTSLLLLFLSPSLSLSSLSHTNTIILYFSNVFVRLCIANATRRGLAPSAVVRSRNLGWCLLAKPLWRLFSRGCEFESWLERIFSRMRWFPYVWLCLGSKPELWKVWPTLIFSSSINFKLKSWLVNEYMSWTFVIFERLGRLILGLSCNFKAKSRLLWARNLAWWL